MVSDIPARCDWEVELSWSSSVGAPPRPPQRYGAPRPWVRWLTVLLVVALGLSASAWLLWAALYHSDPQVASRLVSFRVVDEHRVDVTVLIDRGSDVAATCRVVAQDGAHGVVGAATFVVPAGGASSVMVTESVRTERRAANAVLGGCTTPGQPQPR